MVLFGRKKKRAEGFFLVLWRGRILEREERKKAILGLTEEKMERYFEKEKLGQL